MTPSLNPRLAIVGLGTFGMIHAQCVSGLAGEDVSAIVEPDPQRRANAKAAQPGAEVFSSIDELIASHAADAVVIASRPSTHVALALKALDAGLDVMVEKPAGQNEEELHRLLQRQRERGRIVMVNHLCLFHSLVCPLLQRVQETGFRAAHFTRHRPVLVSLRFPEAHPVDLVMTHDLYIAAQMVKGEEPETFHLMESCGPHGNVDMTWVALRWADGRTATFHSHFTLPPGAPADGFDRIEVFGHDYHSSIDTNPAPWRWTSNHTEWPVALEISSVQGRPTGMLAEAHRAFRAAITGGTVPSGCRVEDALQVQRWITRLKHPTLSS